MKQHCWTLGVEWRYRVWLFSELWP